LGFVPPTRCVGLPYFCPSDKMRGGAPGYCRRIGHSAPSKRKEKIGHPDRAAPAMGNTIITVFPRPEGAPYVSPTQRVGNKNRQHHRIFAPRRGKIFSGGFIRVSQIPPEWKGTRCCHVFSGCPSGNGLRYGLVFVPPTRCVGLPYFCPSDKMRGGAPVYCPTGLVISPRQREKRKLVIPTRSPGGEECH